MIRDLGDGPARITVFDLPLMRDAWSAMSLKHDWGSEILWIDHHLDSWTDPPYIVSVPSKPRWICILPTEKRTTALHLTLAYLWQELPAEVGPIVYLDTRHVRRMIPAEWSQYLDEVIGRGQQTDRVCMFDGLEALVRRGQLPGSEMLKRILLNGARGDRALGEYERGLADAGRAMSKRLAHFFGSPDHVPVVWDIADDVVYVKNPRFGPLDGVGRRHISIQSQKATGAKISIIRHANNWLYAGAAYDANINLLEEIQSIPGLTLKHKPAGHSAYVVSLRGVEIEGQSEPISLIVDHFRKLMRQR